MSAPEHSCAILLSRQPLRPCAADNWVRGVLDAVDWARREGMRIVTSVGMQTWELVLVAALRARVPVDVYPLCPPATDPGRLDAGIRSAFGLMRTDRVMPVSVAEGMSKRDVCARRDVCVLDAADVILPISLRPKGSMAALLARAGDDRRRVVDDFAVPYSRRTAPLKYAVEPGQISAALTGLGDTYLVHWTRTANGRWPTETLRSYYEALLDSHSYPRAGFHTLCNILTTGSIAASTRHMPAHTPTVSFTGRPPCAFVSLMRWRARYREMSFEPYGIGIARNVAAALGIHPVVYCADRGRDPAMEGDAEPWLRQSAGRITPWSDEDEYRCVGDLDLWRVPRGRLVAFCHTSREAGFVESQFGIRAVGFVDCDG